MFVFPRSEQEVEQLARALSDALQDHAPDAGGAALRRALEVSLESYRAAVRERDEQAARLKAANERKDAAIEALRDAARKGKVLLERIERTLPQEEADALRELLRANLVDESGRAPAEPRDLKVRVGEGGVASLTWKRPRRGQGGRVRTYRIETAAPEAAADGSAEWTIVQTAYSTAAEVLLKPPGVIVTIRVRAENPWGISPAGPVQTVYLTP